MKGIEPGGDMVEPLQRGIELHVETADEEASPERKRRAHKSEQPTLQRRGSRWLRDAGIVLILRAGLGAGLHRVADRCAELKAFHE